MKMVDNFVQECIQCTQVKSGAGNERLLIIASIAVSYYM